jgi:hypothetical protein
MKNVLILGAVLILGYSLFVQDAQARDARRIMEPQTYESDATPDSNGEEQSGSPFEILLGYLRGTVGNILIGLGIVGLIAGIAQKNPKVILGGVALSVGTLLLRWPWLLFILLALVVLIKKYLADQKDKTTDGSSGISGKEAGSETKTSSESSTPPPKLNRPL